MTEGKIMTLMLGENNSLIHPLYLQMTIRKAKQLGINRDQFVGVLHNGKIDYLQKLNPSLFVMVKTLQISSNTLQNDSVLLATEEFFKHYNLSVGAQFLFEVVHPIPLDKVVFGAYTSEAFTWCKSEKWNQNIIKMLSSGNILCRNGDIPLFNIGECENPNLIYDLITVECSPVCQGLLTNETSVLVVKLAKSRTDNRNEKTNEVKRDKSVDSFLNLMNYTSRLLIMNQVPSNCLDITNKNVIKSLATSDTALKILRNAKLFNIEIMAKPISEPELCLEEIDLHNSVFISSFDISNSLEISEKMNWIYVKLKYLNNGTRRRISSLSNIKINSNVFDKEAKRVFSLGDIDDIDQDNYPWRLVQIYTLSSFFPNGTANITPQLWFNLNKHHSLLLQPECRLIIKQATPEDIPPFAEEVYLALVLSPNYSSLKSFDHLLKSYFKITRYLKVGDVIALYNKDTSSGDNIVSESFSIDTTLHPTIYFHVSRIVSQTVFKNNELGYRVDINNSRLYQSGTKENYVPVTMETFHCERPFHKIFDSPSPTGPIGKARDELCSIITPFLKSRQLREKVRSNILLSGPVGSGKKLAIQAVCRSLNLHLYSVDCQDLVGEAAGATEMRLRNSATKAMKFTPVIFHLNNVSLLSRERKETSAASGDDPRTIGSFGQVLATLSGPSSETTRPVIVIATTNSTVGLSKSGKGESLHPDLAGLFLYNICMRTPNEEERAAILENLLPMEIPHSISVSRLALKTVVNKPKI